MGHLQHHFPGGAHVAEDDYGAADLPFAVVDRRNGVFDGNFKTVSPNKDAVRRQVHAAILANSQLHGIGNGFASSVIHDSENFGHGQARRFLPRPTGHPLGNGI